MNFEIYLLLKQMQNMVFWHFCSSEKEMVKAIKSMIYNQATSGTGPCYNSYDRAN